MSQIQDPETFFSTLGEQIEERILELAPSLAGDDLKGESFMQKLGRLNTARQEAESQAMREMALLEPESTTSTSAS